MQRRGKEHSRKSLILESFDNLATPGSPDRGKPSVIEEVSPDATMRMKDERMREPKESLGPTEKHHGKSATLKGLEWFLDLAYTQIFMGIVTVYALFADDIRMLAFTKAEDEIFYTLTTVSMGLFLVEIVLCCFAKDGYFNGFFFWLDVISTLSLVGDIGWIVPESSSAGETATDLAKQVRTGRAARIIRLIRLIRLMRISKLYKEARQSRERLQHTNTNTNTRRKSSLLKLPDNLRPDPSDPAPSVKPELRRATSIHRSLRLPPPSRPEDPRAVPNKESEIPQESRTSKRLTDLTTQRVILLILILAFVLPLLSTDSYFGVPEPTSYATQALADAHESMSGAEFRQMCESYKNYQKNEDYYPLVYLSGPDCGPFVFGVSKERLRETEKLFNEERGFLAVTDIRASTKLASGLNIGRTLFLCLILAVGSIVFSHDTSVLVLMPLESMLEKTRILATNPMRFCQAADGDEDFGVYGLARRLALKGATENYETIYLENVIVKIANLLIVEFGEAGTRIIIENLSAGNFLDPMLPGAKMFGIFGFCIINRFADTSKALQTNIMLYVNKIAEVVHSVVDKYYGGTNKNIGDAFLILWRLSNAEVDSTDDGLIAKTSSASFMFDMAVFAYLKIIAKLAKLQHIKDLEKDPEIVAKLPNFKVNLGFGLHTGWAIEGAIGSIYKIDASYLSPNVNIAARLEAATKQYGVRLLLSGSVYRNLSPHVQKLCREIDTITVKGSKLPIQLFTVDIDVSALEPKDCKYGHCTADDKRHQRREKKKIFRDAVSASVITSQQIFASDNDIKLMANTVTNDFRIQFQEGYEDYIAGRWSDCAEKLRQALLLLPQDGPTMTLLSYIESRNCTAPAHWAGFRELTEK
jgi:class 3 adenylate cyclase